MHLNVRSTPLGTFRAVTTKTGCGFGCGSAFSPQAESPAERARMHAVPIAVRHKVISDSHIPFIAQLLKMNLLWCAR
jgi:hypothetical protein